MLSHKFYITSVEPGLRIDKFLAKELKQYSRSNIQSYIESGNLLANGKIIKDCAESVKLLIEYELIIPEISPTDITPSSLIEFEIIYEDQDLIVINKPAGLTVHPGAGNYQDTLVNGLIYYYNNNLSSVGGSQRPGIVHRLDKDTSGLMVVAKNDYAHNFLSKQLANRSLSRTYVALIWGLPNPLVGKINLNIARSRFDRTKMRVVKSLGKTAITNYKFIESYLGNSISMIECVLETGRTHQIRVHLAEISHPIVGDQVYGINKKNKTNVSKYPQLDLSWFNRQALHSKTIGFIHPRSETQISFTINLPPDMLRLLAEIKEADNFK